jgi:hypothetical protein
MFVYAHGSVYGVLEYWSDGVLGLSKKYILFQVLPDKFYNYIIIYFLIKKYIPKMDSRFVNPLILP